MKRFIIPTLVALLGFALCAPASGAPRVSPSDPGQESGSGALRATRTATPHGGPVHEWRQRRPEPHGQLEYFSTIQAAIDAGWHR